MGIRELLKKFGVGRARQPAQSAGEGQSSSENAASATTLAAPRSAKPGAPRVVIGLDYGTHTTKCVVQWRGERPGQVIPLEAGPVAGYPWFGSPSLVSVGEGKMYFGAECTRRRGDKLYRSLKVRLLPAHSRSASDDPPACEVDVLVAAYLSDKLARVRDVLDERFSEGGYYPLLNLAAPMDHLESAQLQDRYLRIIRAAWHTVFGGGHPVEQGAPEGEVFQKMGELLADEEPIPNRATRQYEVLPETVAPMVSMHENPDVEGGLYALIDVGAGTSEISIVRMGTRGGLQRVACYRDVSMAIGGDDLAAPLEARRLVVSKLRSTYEREWERSRRIDARARTAERMWRLTRIVLLGGGGKDPLLWQQLTSLPPWPERQPHFTGFSHSHSWYAPPLELLRCDLAMNETLARNRDEFFLLAVAHGLSYHRMNWPEWFSPTDVTPLHGPGEFVGPSQDEMYSD